MKKEGGKETERERERGRQEKKRRGTVFKSFGHVENISLIFS